MRSIESYAVLICLLHAATLLAQQPVNAIRINQEGYYPQAPKYAVLVVNKAARDFCVVSGSGKDTVFKGQLGELKTSANSALQTQLADFSTIRKTGTYRLVVPGTTSSYTFRIAPSVHHSSAVALLKGYYYQRVSTALEATYAGSWHRPAGHPDNVVLIHPSAVSTQRPAGTVISSPGGWYDAGDYNKYIVNSGITMGTLLSAYEDFATYFDTLRTHIPESRNRIPDVLDEVLVNLRWMLTMQDPADGGVYNKCTNAAFDGMVMPGVTKAPRYVVQKGTAATLDFAAVMAQASRILKRFNKQLPGLSDSCLLAAKAAWQWAAANPALVYDQDKINREFKPVISTGGYGDRNFSDEWYWAAAELWITTGDDQYASLIGKADQQDMSIPSWATVRMLGHYSLLRSGRRYAAKYPASATALKEKLLRYADGFVDAINNNAFHTVMGRYRTDFVWGSSAVAANQGILLINAWLLSKDRRYFEAALTNLDYLLGRNATGYSFVTGIGTQRVMKPHHRPSVADGIVDPVPGLLSGGPNPGQQDRCKYEYAEPETSFTDQDCSYASNEIAINWNAPAVYLAAAIEALYKRVGY
ncbi:glycoside hydrolase family 9 protein [Paraflavitalea sp. CAU 1676]|uniref:glycoside hydrolase family 9 protein n=1 Tax=Paraflavitalea sp. CAU 1676 TaxID=3032598 RepID=UPI0023D9A631|nr:glycoside hydrolase family 9 protein [Paraflavitalea sp. CAU 1676]MDF2189551.1 glycoside hydrolase family 9 protein [Paraflavitalea sp. CAU 1676]